MRQGIAVIAATRGGARVSGEIAAALRPRATPYVPKRWLGEAPPDAAPFDGPLAEQVAKLFHRVEALIFVLATGATVRLVAPLLGTKQGDPAVLAVDERGEHVVALLGGHQADANALATTIADAIGATPVISTASDVLGLPALDLLGKAEGWRIEASAETVRRASAAVVDGQVAAIFQEAGGPEPIDDLPAHWPRLSSLADLDDWPGPRLIVSDRALDDIAEPREPVSPGPIVMYRPPTLVLGVGCSLGAAADEIEALARAAIKEAGLAWGSVGVVATIEHRLSEPGVVEIARRAGARLVGYPAAELAEVPDLPSPSAEVARHVGTPGVCEPAALLASDGGSLIVPKHRSARATVAIARRAPDRQRAGKLWLVGIGPGPLDQMTGRARRAVRIADVVVGYRGYLDMLTAIVAARRLRPYELGQERERAAEAIGLARAGRQVALVSSGDVGIYGMAGLVFELLEECSAADRGREPDVEVIPGVTAASAAGALLGAPLMLDFAAISLSDLLVPWETIRRRLLAAAEGDLVVVLYNPASARRRRPLAEALTILQAHRPSDTPVGLVRDGYRAEQRVVVTTLGELPAEQVDMRTVVVIGSTRTATLGGRMVSRRGYLGEVGDVG
jgi:cobalt-precorrin 5A hydrolase/precorrin-3B C17-methyltransferase